MQLFTLMGHDSLNERNICMCGFYGGWANKSVISKFEIGSSDLERPSAPFIDDMCDYQPLPTNKQACALDL